MWQPMKSSLRGIALLIAACALFAGRGADATPIAISASAAVAPVPTNAGTGLAVKYYTFGNTEPTSWANASSMINSGSGPVATFNTTQICYPNCAGGTINDSSTTMQQYVANGASNFAYTVPSSQIPTTIANSAMVITGYLDITQAGTYTFNLGSDDGSLLYIGGQQIINGDSQRNQATGTQQVSFTQAGLYAITIDYYEVSGSAGLDFYASAPNGTCVIGRAANCASGSTAQTNLFYSSIPSSGTAVPEPGSLFVMATSLLGLCGALVWRRRAA
jgi:PA14 domain/PEP-CTERM motif